jgi:diaminohydroxyphosphoribosylaminopyrimidine deaminase / 5-amino-6-(5-phosphoribosylamino)uracil reductase
VQHRPPPRPCPPVDAREAAAWRALLAAAATGERCEEAHPLVDLLSPLLTTRSDRTPVFAHLAQSLDGRIALPDGSAFWISGPEDVRHTHRMRALADAVIVGAETVARDNPQLTVRQVEGPQPLRVVLDPRGRVSDEAHLCTDGHPTLLIRQDSDLPAGTAAVATLPQDDFAPREVLALLAARGVRRVLIEGGGITISRFLAAGCLDRLHLVVAPVLLGSGRPGLQLPLGEVPATCPRPVRQRVALGEDTLYDLDLSAVGPDCAGPDCEAESRVACQANEARS